MSLKILIVEDDDNKRRQVAGLIGTLTEPFEIEEARSLQSALAQLRTKEFDVVVLDMTMPSFDISHDEDGGRPQAFGGREVIRHLARRDAIVPVVVLTQFDRFGSGGNERTLDELDGELRNVYGDRYLGSVYYSPMYDTWKEQLLLVLREVSRQGRN